MRPSFATTRIHGANMEHKVGNNTYILVMMKMIHTFHILVTIMMIPTYSHSNA